MSTNKKVVCVLTNLLLITLIVLDSKYIINIIFAIVFTNLIFLKFNRCSLDRYIYYLTILFAVMGSALAIPLSDDFILSQINVFYIYLFMYIVLYLYNKIKEGNLIANIKTHVNIRYLIPILFILYVYGSFFVADNKILAIKQLFIYTIMFSLMIMTIIENISSEKRKDTIVLLKYLAIGILVLGSLKILTGFNIEARSIYTDYNIINNTNLYVKRVPTVFFNNPNDYAFIVVIILLSFFGDISNSRNIQECKKEIGIYIVGIINLIFTMSRTAWLAFGIAIIFICIYALIIKNIQLFKKVIILTITSFCIIVGLGFVPSLDEYYGKIKIDLSEVMIRQPIYLADSNPYMELPPQDKGKYIFGVMIGGENSVNRRVTLLYDVAKGVFIEKNYFGFGVGNTEQYLMEQNNTYGLYKIHCLWFELLGDFGVFGLALFLSTYIIVFINLLRRRLDNIKDIKYLLYLVSITILVFGPSSVVIMPVFWMIIALVYSRYIEINQSKGCSI